MTTQCYEIQLLLVEYASGELSPIEMHKVSGHLTTCHACREELAREKHLRKLLGSLPEMALGTPAEKLPDFPNSAGEVMAPSNMRRWSLTVSGMAAIFVIAFLGPNLVDRNVQVEDFGPTGNSHSAQLDTQPSPIQKWSKSELEKAQDELAFTLALTARIMRKGERTAVRKAFGKTLPQVISGSVHKAIKLNEGDKG